MSHYNVNGSVAKTLIQYLVRWVVETEQFDEAASATLLSILEHRDLAGARARVGERRAAEHAVEDRALRAAGLPPVLHHALRHAAVEGRVPRAGTRGATRRAARGRPTSPTTRGTPTTSRRSSAGSACSCIASSRSASSSARRCRTARRSCPAATCRRAATGARRPTATRGSGSTSSNGRSRTPELAAAAGPHAYPLDATVDPAFARRDRRLPMTRTPDLQP